MKKYLSFPFIPNNFYSFSFSFSRLSSITDKLLETEKKYVEDLSLICKYMNELKRPEAPEDLKQNHTILFENIKAIYDFHKMSLNQELQSCRKTAIAIAHCFLRHVSEDSPKFGLNFKLIPLLLGSGFRILPQLLQK